jgi:hypothetical protein
MIEQPLAGRIAREQGLDLSPEFLITTASFGQKAPRWSSCRSSAALYNSSTCRQRWASMAGCLQTFGGHYSRGRLAENLNLSFAAEPRVALAGTSIRVPHPDKRYDSIWSDPAKDCCGVADS